METWDLVSRFPSRYRHLEFLIRLLIGPIFKTPSWIWKTIESIVLETIAYCLSRLLIGYRPYERGIVVYCATDLGLPSTLFRHENAALFLRLGNHVVSNK